MTSKLANPTTPLRDAVLKAWDHFEGLSSVKDRDSWFTATARAGLSANIEDDDKVHRLGEKIEKTVRSAERQSRTWRAAYNLTEAGKIDLDGKRLSKDMAKTLSKIESTQKDLIKIKQLSSDDLLLSEVDHALSTMRPTIQAFEAAIKMGQRGLKMSTLQTDLIKLAYNKPHLRAKILPILERAVPAKTSANLRELRIRRRKEQWEERDQRLMEEAYALGIKAKEAGENPTPARSKMWRDWMKAKRFDAGESSLYMNAYLRGYRGKPNLKGWKDIDKTAAAKTARFSRKDFEKALQRERKLKHYTKDTIEGIAYAMDQWASHADPEDADDLKYQADDLLNEIEENTDGEEIDLWKDQKTLLNVFSKVLKLSSKTARSKETWILIGTHSENERPRIAVEDMGFQTSVYEARALGGATRVTLMDVWGDSRGITKALLPWIRKKKAVKVETTVEDALSSWSKRASTKTAGAGPANAMYLQSIPPAKKAKILKHIANHYGVSVREIEKEMVDRDAENLFEYAASDRSMAMDILRDFKRMRLMASKTANDERSILKAKPRKMPIFDKWIGQAGSFGPSKKRIDSALAFAISDYKDFPMEEYNPKGLVEVVKEVLYDLDQMVDGDGNDLMRSFPARQVEKEFWGWFKAVHPSGKQADVQKTAINQDTQDFIDWIYTTRQGQALSTSEVVTALKKAGVVQKSPKKKRSGPRFQVGDEVIINFKKAKADPRFYPAFVGGPGGTQLEEKAWKKLDGKVGKVKQAGTGVTAKFGSTEIWMQWGQESRGIPLYKYFPPTVIEAKSPKLEIVYLAGGQSSDEAKLTVTNYLARGSQRGQQRPAYYYTGYSYGWRVGRNGPYFEILAQQRFQFNPDKVGDRLGQGGYAPRSFNPAVGQMLYLGVFNSRPSGWKSDVESWKAESSGE